MREKASRVFSTTAVPSVVSWEPFSTTRTALVVSVWIAPISPVISVAACWVSSASFLTSSATTANPRPCSPARAASIAALSASRLVWAAIRVIVSTIAPICLGLGGQLAHRVAGGLAGLADRAHRVGRLRGGADAFLGDLAGFVGDLGGLAGVLGRLGHRAGDSSAAARAVSTIRT